MSRYKAWIGVDFDGTLAHYDGWHGPTHTGKPIVSIVNFVKGLLHNGVNVKIVTARYTEGAAAIAAIEAWCQIHLGRVLPVTDRKDGGMVFLIDDRAIAVEKNTGQFLSPVPLDLVDHTIMHDSPDNPENPENVSR